MNAEDLVVQKLSLKICKRIAHQTQIALQKMTDCKLSGDDSALANTWEEICIELQTEQSLAWSAYEQTMRAFVGGHVAQLPRHEALAAWLQTDDAFDRRDLDKESTVKDLATIPICEEAIVDMILKGFVFPEATDWSNSRIRRYLDGRQEPEMDLPQPPKPKRYLVDFYDSFDREWIELDHYFDSLEEAIALSQELDAKLNGPDNYEFGDHYGVIDMQIGKEVYCTIKKKSLKTKH